MNYNKISSKLIHYYSNDYFFYLRCRWIVYDFENIKFITDYSDYSDSYWFQKIKNEYIDLHLSDLMFKSFLEGLRTDKNEMLVMSIFYMAGIKARKLK